jgi:threonylcarbamoyladenosine tRNA methylthiotransferase MtaB
VIRKLSEENKMQYYSRFIGKRQTVLVEKITRQGLAKGFGEHYLPVEFRPERAENNYFANVIIREVDTTSKILRGFPE